MKVLTVEPGRAGSAQLEERTVPPGAGAMVVRMLCLGVCGTDREILSGSYGAAPSGSRRLVLGHESLGRIVEAPVASGFERGDLVAGVVRRPDPVPCASCAAGDWDMCRNGRYSERGIKALDGFGAEQIRLEPAFAVKVDPALGRSGVLVEPASVVAKAWAHIDHIGRRSESWAPGQVLVTGAGAVGLMATMMARQRSLPTHVLDHATSGPKPQLVAATGATYQSGESAALGALAPDIVLECTGDSEAIRDAMMRVAPGGIVCLLGVSAEAGNIALPKTVLTRDMVLDNRVVFGSVNANRRHFELAAQALAAADRDWLAALLSRTVPLGRWTEAFERRRGEVKVVIDFDG
jgi:threonine dehydrogenase-like Zn-dependent dehydrogenase